MDGIKLLSILVLFANAATVLCAVLILASKLGYFRKYWLKVEKLIQSRSLKLVLLVSVVAAFGSLYLSEIRAFPPCKLCWFQRIFMYPIPVLVLTSIYRKTKDLFQYLMPLSFIGMLIAGYHYYLQLNPNPYAPCGDIGFSVSCSENFFTHFGYITIPWMSFSAFLVIFSVSLLMSGSDNPGVSRHKFS